MLKLYRIDILESIFGGTIMKRAFKKFLSGLLSLTLIVCVFSVCITLNVFADEKICDYYVGFGGTGDGTDVNNPAPSVAVAVNTVNKNGLTANDTANIYIVQDIAKPSTAGKANAIDKDYTAHNLAYWGNVQSHTAKIVVMPHQDNQSINTNITETYLAVSDALGKQDKMVLSGPTEFKNIRIIYPYGSSIENRTVITINGNQTVFDKDVTFGYVKCTSANEENWTGDIKTISPSDTPMLLGMDMGLSDVPYNQAFKVKYDNQMHFQTSSICVPAYKTGNYSFNNDLTLEFTNNNKGHYVTFGTVEGNSTTTFEKNLNIKITGEKSIIRFNNGNDNVVVKGAVQLIAEQSVGYALNDKEDFSLDSITTLVKQNSSQADTWVLNVEPHYIDRIDFIEGEKGKFSVSSDCVAYAIDSEGNEIVSHYGLLDLSAKSGKYNVRIEYLGNYTYEFYVKKDGISYNDSDVYGMQGTIIKPYATVGDVLKAVNANEKINVENTMVNVYIMQDITSIIGNINKSHNIAYWGDYVEHKATLVLKGYKGNSYNGQVKDALIATSKTLSEQAVLKFGGPTVFDDVLLVYTSSSNVDAGKIVVNGQNVTFGANTKFAYLKLNGKSFSDFTTDPGDITELLTDVPFIGTWFADDTGETPVRHTRSAKLILEKGYTTSGTRAVYLGGYNSIFENDITLEINVGNFDNTRVNLGKKDSAFITVYEKNLNIKIKDSSSTDSDYFGFRPESRITVNGGLHLIKSDNIHFHNNNPYKEFSSTAYKADGVTKAETWILDVAEKDVDKIDFIEGEKGKFAVELGYKAIAKLVVEEGKKSKIVESENGVLDLSALTGEYTITFETVKQKTMFYYKEVKTKSGDTLLQQTKPLRAGVEYTMSFDYYINCTGLDDTFYVSFYGGVEKPGTSKIINEQLFSTREQHGNLFPEFSYDGKKAIFKFTLTKEQVESNNYFYMGFRYLPGCFITEAYFANMMLYETLDEAKENLFISDEFETKIDNWYSSKGATQSGNNKVFEHKDVDFIAYYLPYNELYFDSPTSVHYGDTNLDGDIDLLDLVTIAETNDTIKNYLPTVDANQDGVIDDDDLTVVKKHLIGAKVYEWTKKEVGLMKPNVMSGGSDDEAALLKEQIMSAPDTLKKASSSNKTYYVAASGSASNDGLSQSKPITADAVNSLSLKAGDLVLFKRGDTMRLSDMIKPVRGVSYGAYGSGAKPVLLGSLRNYAKSSLWKSSDNNLWEVSLGTDDAAQVIFNNGEFIGFRKHTLEEVTFNGDFYYDKTAKKLYLYLNNINPGLYFDSIEIATTSRAFGTWGSAAKPVNDLKFENICMKYFSLFAFNISYTDGIDITNCEMGWIGGQITGSNADRFGNAVQLWNSSSNANISNNYIYQVFDAAITFQGNSDNIYKNITMKDNLIEYTSMNFEFWGSNSSTATSTSSDPACQIHNIKFEDNVLRFSGYGWGGQQRKLKPNQAFVLSWNYKYDDGQVKDFTIKNNVFDVANSSFYYATKITNHLDISSNTYYQKSGSVHSVVRGNNVYSNNFESFESAIKIVDTAPSKIEWID